MRRNTSNKISSTKLSNIIKKKNTPIDVIIDDGEFILLKKSQYNKLLNEVNKITEQLVESILEKEIIKEIPRDFEDAYIVAKNMLYKTNSNKKPTINDIRKTIKNIKVNYPNLFIDMKQYFEDNIQEDKFNL